MQSVEQTIQNPPQSFIVFFLCFSRLSSAQLFERITIVENSPLNTDILDIRAALVRHGEGQLPENATAYASQQELFWPFALDNFVLRLVRPLDREVVCQLHQQKFHRLDKPPGQNPPLSASLANDGCLAGACCQLLHVNILPTPTALPKAFFIQVVVQDVNDNAPRFPVIHSPYTVVHEDSGLEERIWLPQAIDPDSPQYSVTEYRTENWVHGNQSHFQIGVDEERATSVTPKDQYSQLYGVPVVQRMATTASGRPYLIPTAPLDRELCDLYAFTLIAVDGGDRNAIDVTAPNRALTGSVYVVIKVADVNDNRPTFDRSHYEAKIVENFMPANVFTFDVVDKDIGENGRVSISIQDTSRTAEQTFRVSLQAVHSPTYQSSGSHHTKQHQTLTGGSHYRGYVQLISRIDAERFPPFLQFSLVASDFGKPSLSSSADVQIQIININDNAPNIAFFSRGKRLTDGRILLPEVTTPPRSLVVLVHVTDEDSPISQFRCQIVSETEMFSLDEASSHGFPSYHSDVTFESPLESRGIVASYRQYAIRTKKELDRETKSYYVVTVECTDAEGVNSLARNASLHITVTDENDHNPVFDKLNYHGRVQENSPAAEVQFSSPIKVTDADIGPNALLTFLISDLDNTTEQAADFSKLAISRNGSQYFRIDPRSGRIWTTVALDCEVKNQYDLLVVVHDSGLPESRSSTANLIVSVEDVNDNVPEFSSAHYTFEVAENAPPGTEIGRVEATDKDATEPNRKLRYGLTGRADDLHLVSINRNTGVLRTRRPIDRESRSSITLTATAENELPVRASLSLSPNRPLGPTELAAETIARTNIVLNVLNVNDNRPEFTLIEPHRSHVTFIWEQLSSLPNTTNVDSKSLKNGRQESLSVKKNGMGTQTEAKDMLSVNAINVSPVCERLPHRVTDKDVEQDGNSECCVLQLQEDFDGLFALMPEAPTVLCMTRRPPVPTSYKLVLIAKDGTANDSLSAQVQFTVVIRSDPSLRGVEASVKRGSLSQLTEKERNGFSNIDSSYRLDDLSTSSTWPYTSNSKDLRSSGRSGQMQQRNMLPNGHKGGNLPTGHTQQTIIIVVMASVAGILCVLLLLAIVLTKRCFFDSRTADFIKVEAESPHEGSVGVKSPGSVHSTPSKSQTCTLLSIPAQHLPPHSDYYSKEMIYHHTMGDCNQAYEMATRTGFLSPTIDRNIIRLANVSSPPGGMGVPSLLPVSLQAQRQVNAVSPMLPGLLDANVYKNESKNKQSSPERSAAKYNVYTAWPPLPHSHVGARSALIHRAKHVAPNNVAKQLVNKPGDAFGSNTHGIYQTIDSRLVPTIREANRVKPTLFRSSTVMNSRQDYESDKALLEPQDHPADLESTDQKQLSAASGSPCQDFDVLPENKGELKKLQRTNSERSTYFQTSFV
ncbi:long-chain fatty acid transporter fat1 [Clonorchis sinensis]|uniref:Long-chain fatty acid transporter fat1 n=1 Tax=Clonorchis sinensis TaxID=79923 RepID=A0A3R7D3G0_CLOSI|nr:long-chain fatty acid transporter fat1 [Clonorchis sinensis]